MKYMLLIYANPSEAPQYSPEVQQAWAAVGEEAKAAGVWVTSAGLAPISDATTVRVRDSKTLVADGPFAETHEHLAGYFLLNCNDLDEAIGWAGKIPAALYGSIEIRPLNAAAQQRP